MQESPYKLEEPPVKPTNEWTFKLTRRSVLWLAVTGLVGTYLGLTIWFYETMSKSWPTVSYMDCALYPFKEESIRQKQGAYLFEQALDAERRGELSEAIRLYSNGLERIPTSWANRIKLVRMSLNERRAFGVPELLREGMKLSSRKNVYVDAVVNIAWEMRDYELTIEACDLAIKDSKAAGGQEARISQSIEKKAVALLASGQLAQAVASLPALAEDARVETVLDRVTLLLRLQLPVDSIKVIEKWEHRYPGNLKLLRLLARSQREIDDLEAMEATMAKCIKYNPDAREAWSAVVVNRALTFNIAGAREAMEKFFVKFYGKPDDLFVLGLDLALIGNRELLVDCIAESNLNGYPGIELRKLLVEMEVNKGSWESSAKLLDEISTARKQRGIPVDDWYVFYRSLCDAALYDEPEKQLAFLNILRGEKAISTASALESFIRLLSWEGRDETAREIAKLAHARFPVYRDWPQYVRQLELK